MGCCSCCWIGDRLSLDTGAGGQQANFTAPRNSCDGCCARRCRLPDVHSKELTPLSARAGRRGLGSPGSAGSSNWMVAHAHLSRLIGATGAAPSSSPGSTHQVVHQHKEAGISSTASEHHDCRNNARVCKPRPHRFGPSTSAIARQNPRLLSLLAGLLCYDPDERLTPLQALAHPFFGEALPFAAVPQTATIPAASRTKVELTTPAGTTRARPVARVGLSPPQQVASPDLLHGSSVDNNGRHVQREAVTSRTLRPQNGSKTKSMQVWSDSTAAAAATRLAVPSCAKASVSCSGAPTMPPYEAESDTANRELDPTVQLRRLAEMAEAMVKKGTDCYSRARDGGADAGGSGGGIGIGIGNDTVSTAVALPSPRRNSVLNAALLARLKHEEQSTSTGTSRVPRTTTGEQQHQQYQHQQHQHQQGNPFFSKTSSAPSVGARATTSPPARRRRPNRFLTPATLAMLNPDVGEKEAAAAAAEWLGWSAGRTRSSTSSSSSAATSAATAATRKHPSKRATPPPDGKKSSLRTTPTRTPRKPALKANHTHEKEWTEAGSEGEEEGTDDSALRGQQRGPDTAARKRSRKSATGDWTRASESGSQGATPSRARGGGRTTTPRRAAVAAGAALLRLRDDDESSDGSLTL